MNSARNRGVEIKQVLVGFVGIRRAGRNLESRVFSEFSLIHWLADMISRILIFRRLDHEHICQTLFLLLFLKGFADGKGYCSGDGGDYRQHDQQLNQRHSQVSEMPLSTVTGSREFQWQAS